jgi:hypothetical protein
MLYFTLAKEIGGERIIVEVWDEHGIVGCIYLHESTVAVISKLLEG